jgi:hypothetical protein
MRMLLEFDSTSSLAIGADGMTKAADFTEASVQWLVPVGLAARRRAGR